MILSSAVAGALALDSSHRRDRRASQFHSSVRRRCLAGAIPCAISFATGADGRR